MAFLDFDPINTPLQESAQEVFDTRGFINRLVISNPHASAAAFVKFYLSSATIVVATDEPTTEIFVPAATTLDIDLGNRACPGFRIAAGSVTGADATAPTADLTGWLEYSVP